MYYTKQKFPSNSPEQNTLAIKQYQTSFFESLMPEQNRNKPKYIIILEKKIKCEN